jgi:putative glutamine amidotransferase
VRPAIGIPLCLDARGRWRADRDYLYIDRAYARAVERAGGLPVLLPLQAPERAAELVARIDALLLPGGDDFAPERAYPDEVVLDLAEPVQIAFDRALVAAARAAELPVLGICYGMQLLALEAGGALHHHVPTDVEGALDHGAGAAGTRDHAIEVEKASRLAHWLGAVAAVVNSRHHQAVADAGRLTVSARAADGVIEAIESTGSSTGPLQIGVQWHPETLAGPAGEGLLRHFVALAAGRAG